LAEARAKCDRVIAEREALTKRQERRERMRKAQEEQT
jgi:hypothetical protein